MMEFLAYDTAHIHQAQRETLSLLINRLDMDKVCFVGGIADYLNLREYFEMPVHDIDLVFHDEADLAPIADVITLERFRCKFYEFDDMEVIVGNHMVGERRIHIDFFRRNYLYGSLSTSDLLGHRVRHTSFESMQKFHNEHIPKLTSRAQGSNYEWKRLYKHSKKASLYNLLTYRRSKQQKSMVYESA